ncbi:hypothetical protein LLG95_02795 [bacterium]|nr:hypothetical protein [bacterium]
MTSSPSISALESAAADLSKLLSGWTHDRLAEAEAAHANPSDPDARSRRPNLVTINAGIQSLWRLVSVQKSILQLKTPPSAPPPDRPAPQFQSGVQTSVCPSNRPPSEFLFGVQTSVCSGKNPSPAIDSHSTAPITDSPKPQSSIDNPQSLTLPSSVPFVPVVPSVPTYRSIEEIAAKTKKLYDQTVALVSANGLAVPGIADLPIGKSPLGSLPLPASAGSNRKSADPIKSKLLEAITSRPTFPGSSNLLDSIRADLLTSPP